MYKKILTLVMTVVVCCFLCIPASFSTKASSPLEQVKEGYQTLVKQNEVISSTKIEGITIACRYVKNTKEYYLTMEDEEYKLNVFLENGDILFDIAEQKEKKYVYGQSPAIVGLGLLAPEVISAIETCLVGITSVIGITGTAYISVSLVDRIFNSATITKLNTEVADAAISLSISGTSAKTDFDNSYFEARLLNDSTIFIGRILTYKEALIRLRGGFDIMAISREKAFSLASVASPIKKQVWHAAHPGPGVRYDHYHPIGIKWYKNPKYHPHVWYV